MNSIKTELPKKTKGHNRVNCGRKKPETPEFFPVVHMGKKTEGKNVRQEALTSRSWILQKKKPKDSGFNSRGDRGY